VRAGGDVLPPGDVAVSADGGDAGASVPDAPAPGDAGLRPDGPMPDVTGGGDRSLPGPDAISQMVDDGTPTRQACTNNYGSALSRSFGRLDGFLMSIVPVGQHDCNGDSSHLHLQIQAQGGIYDVAVNLDVEFTERDLALPDGPWQEGWHTGIGLDYVQLGLHSGDFTAISPSALADKLTAELAQANHISVFATGYGPTGVHDVHRNGGGRDGAIVIQPLSRPAHLLFFHFTDQSF
jgi:hypothetical protein